MLKFSCFFLMLLSSCKPFATVKNIDKHETLFDKLMARAPHQKVPYPFTELLSYLGQYGKPVGVLVPLGRSLQRHAASFADPRRIVGFAALEPLENSPAAMSEESIAEFDLSGRLFLGYVENTKQIEVMSLLPGQEVFDFQTVENYGMPEMQVQSHSLAMCRSCHQHGGPIFTPFSWEETNFAHTIALLIKRHHPLGHVDTIPIAMEPETEEQNEEELPPSPAQEFEDLVTQAANLLSGHRLWQACANATCRAYVLNNTFALFDLSLSPPAHVNIPVVTPAAEIISDRFIATAADLNIFTRFNEDDEIKAAVRGYRFSPAAQSIVAKIKKMPQNFRELEQDEFLSAQFVSVFIEAAHIITGEEIPHIFSALSNAEMQTIYAEIERIVTHVHRQDLHLHSDHDPQQKRESFEKVNIFKSIIDRLPADILRQQLLLPANLKSTARLEKIELSFLAKDFGSRVHIELFRKFSSIDEPLSGDVHGDCKNRRCTFKNFFLHGTVFVDQAFVNATVRVQEFDFVINTNRATRPSPSKITFVADDKTYRYELLCSKAVSSRDNNNYLCTVYDRWKLTAAIDKLSKNKTSPLHDDIFNPVAVIKALLAELGYDLKTYAGKIDWRKTHRTATIYRQGSQLHKNVRNILTKHSRGASLLKRCGGCHDTNAIPAPFLAADTIVQLCHNIAAVRDDIIYRLDPEHGIGNMPPPHTSQSENFSDKERQALLAAFQKSDFNFCEKNKK